MSYISPHFQIHYPQGKSIRRRMDYIYNPCQYQDEIWYIWKWETLGRILFALIRGKIFSIVYFLIKSANKSRKSEKYMCWGSTLYLSAQWDIGFNHRNSFYLNVGHGRHRKTRKVANTESQGYFLPTLENYFGSTPLANSVAMLTFWFPWLC